MLLLPQRLIGIQEFSLLYLFRFYRHREIFSLLLTCVVGVSRTGQYVIKTISLRGNLLESLYSRACALLNTLFLRSLLHNHLSFFLDRICPSISTSSLLLNTRASPYQPFTFLAILCPFTSTIGGGNINPLYAISVYTHTLEGSP